LDSFRYHHGGAQTEAEIQLRGMLKDFLLRSARRVSQTGYLVLSREGYELTLSPARDTITGYSTIHRERTWEQVKTGVKSRFKGHGKTREATGPAPEAGPPLQLEQFPNAFDPASVHLTGRVRGSYAKLAGLSWASDEELDGHIREAASHIRQGKVARRGDGMFEIAAADRTWLVSADCQSLVGVKSDALPT
jgi:hypothetical protein